MILAEKVVHLLIKRYKTALLYFLTPWFCYQLFVCYQQDRVFENSRKIVNDENKHVIVTMIWFGSWAMIE